jgi:hypothetical protein
MNSTASIAPPITALTGTGRWCWMNESTTNSGSAAVPVTRATAATSEKLP